MRTLSAVLTGIILWLTAALVMADDILIQDPWVRAAPPQVKILAAYMKIENSGGQLRTLTGATSPYFEHVEIHNTIIHKGLARMVREQKLEIPPQGSVVFSPGGYHFMLIGPKGEVNPGETIDLTLTFHNGDQISIKAEVVRGMVMKSGMDHTGHTKH